MGCREERVYVFSSDVIRAVLRDQHSCQSTDSHKQLRVKVRSPLTIWGAKSMGTLRIGSVTGSAFTDRPLHCQGAPLPPTQAAHVCQFLGFLPQGTKTLAPKRWEGSGFLPSFPPKAQPLASQLERVVSINGNQHGRLVSYFYCTRTIKEPTLSPIY